MRGLYDYDDLNRLLSAQSGGLSIGDYRESYTYDSLGNMTSKSDVGSMLYEGTGAGGTNPHAVTEVNGTAYTYDANGNLLSDGTHSYTWDKRNRLIGGSGQSFSYDFSGQRYKTVDSAAGTNVYTYYITPLMELRDHSPASAGTLVYNIFAGSQRVATVSEGLYSYVVQDHLGGTALITDDTGTVTEVYDYYPYGAELIEDLLGTTETAHTFTDKEFSEELGLYYFEARWYNPSIGRFASLDPAQLDGRVVKLLQDPQSFNFYAYSRNNPINLVDPSGEYFESFIDVGFIVFDVATIVHDQVTTGGANWAVNTTALAADVAGLLTPGLTGFGAAVRVAETANTVDNVYDAAKTLTNTADNVSDVTKSSKTGPINNASFASQQQLGETGQSIAGAGSDTTFRDAQTYADKHGGSSTDYAKIKSDTQYISPTGKTFETHWVQNVTTGEKFGEKTKFIK